MRVLAGMKRKWDERRENPPDLSCCSRSPNESDLLYPRLSQGARKASLHSSEIPRRCAMS